MGTNEPRFIIVESREGAKFLEEGTEIQPISVIVMLVDESKIDLGREVLTREAIAITVQNNSQKSAFRDLRKQALDELGIEIGPLTVKGLDGETMGPASKLGIL